MAKTSKFEIYKNKKGEFRWRLIATNGEPVATGEAYASKKGVMNVIAKLKDWASTAEVVEVAK